MYLLPWGILTIIIVIIDFLSKKLVEATMSLGQSIPLIEGVFNITFIKNDGASFGILPGGRWLFIALTLVLIGILLTYTLKKKVTDKLFLCAVAFIAGGGIGNLIDRIFWGEVIDFFDFCLINFAIFNIADCFVVVGAILMAIYCVISETKNKSLVLEGENGEN